MKTNLPHALYVAVVFAIIFSSYLIPAFANGFPKGSDTYYHMRISKMMTEGGFPVLYDPLNAGGAANPYPPMFHLLMAAAFVFAEPMAAATWLGPLLFMLSATAFYVFSSGMLGKEKGLAATLIYGISLNIIWWSHFSAPLNLAMPLMLLSLYFAGRFSRSKKREHVLISTALAFLLALTHALTFIMFILAYLLLFREQIKNAYLPLLSVSVFALWLCLAGAGGSSLLAFPGFGLASFLSSFQLPLLLLLVIGIQKSDKRLTAWFAVLFAWILLVPLYPERVTTYSIIPASMIASSGFWFLRSRPEKVFTFAAAALLLLSLPVFYDLEFTKAEIKTQDIEAMKWIRSNTPEDSVIASTWQVSGAWIPALAERANILGAYQEVVPDYALRRLAIDAAFSSDDREDIVSALSDYGTDYVYINQWEDNVLYPGAIERLGSVLEAVYENGYSHVYKI